MVLTGMNHHTCLLQSQLTLIQGPLLTTGDELASAASQALSENLTFEDISEFV